MITPEQMDAYKAYAEEAGDAILAAITERQTSVFADAALVSYLYHAHCAAVMRSTVATPEQTADIIAVSVDVGEFAKTKAENEMRALGLLRPSDG